MSTVAISLYTDDDDDVMRRARAPIKGIFFFGGSLLTQCVLYIKSSNRILKAFVNPAYL